MSDISRTSSFEVLEKCVDSCEPEDYPSSDLTMINKEISGQTLAVDINGTGK